MLFCRTDTIILLLALSSIRLFANDVPINNGYVFKDRVYRLGQYKDKKPRKILFTPHSLAGVRPTVVLSDIMTPVKDQGNRGSCAYFSTTALIESIIKQNQQIDVNISEE